MSLLSVGAAPAYYLPSSESSVPQAWKSNSAAKPVECSLQTTNVPALSGDQGANGTSNIQLSLGAGSGYICNPYLRFDAHVTTSAVGSTVAFKGPNALATACINTYTTYLNSVQVDQIANADQVYEQIISHGSSQSFIERDASILMNAGVQTATAAGEVSLGTQVVPLLGLLGSQQCIPAFLCSGTLQISIQWNSLLRAFYVTGAATVTAMRISNVQLVYDRINPEDSFVAAMKSEMAMGQKYVLGYMNLENSAYPVASTSASIQYGLNVSSLKGVVASQIPVTEEAATAAGLSSSNTLTNFACSVDGRLLNNTQFIAGVGDAAIFQELQKVFSRAFDASVSDVATNATFPTNFFAVGVSACRVNEALAFTGSKATQVSIQYNRSAGANATLYLTFMSDRQVLIDASGQITLVR